MNISQRVAILTMMPLPLLISWGAVGVTPATGPLRVHPTNPRYFTDGSGRVVYLTGSHTRRNVQDSANVPDFASYLDFLVKHGHNYTRLWVYRGSPGGPALMPTIYVRTGPGTALDGGLKYDLSKFNQAFFDQLRARCSAAQECGIYVQVMLDSSETARTEAPGNINWPVHPYNSANNINGVNGDPDGDKWGYEIFSLQVAALTTLNESYARKVVDTLSDLDNVLYEIVNEANHDSKLLQYHMINYIRDYEATHKPKRHPAGMTSYRDPGKTRNEWLRQTLDASPEEPTVLCCHIPLVALREERVLSHSFGFGSYATHDAELLKIVEAHADTVIAVLSGHLHLMGVVRRNGIYHIGPSGSATYPCDYGALFTVFPDRIKVQIQSLPRELAVANDEAIGFRGSIHGKPRHKQDFVDGGHATPQLYQSGRSDEREFEIPLSGKKRLGVR